MTHIVLLTYFFFTQKQAEMRIRWVVQAGRERVNVFHFTQDFLPLSPTKQVLIALCSSLILGFHSSSPQATKFLTPRCWDTFFINSHHSPKSHHEIAIISRWRRRRTQNNSPGYRSREREKVQIKKSQISSSPTNHFRAARRKNVNKLKARGVLLVLIQLVVMLKKHWKFLAAARLWPIKVSRVLAQTVKWARSSHKQQKWWKIFTLFFQRWKIMFFCSKFALITRNFSTQSRRISRNSRATRPNFLSNERESFFFSPNSNTTHTIAMISTGNLERDWYEYGVS